jgi:hypothetical protein
MKPRLRCRFGLWECVGSNYSAWAPTRLEAWKNWLKLSLSRYDF